MPRLLPQTLPDYENFDHMQWLWLKPPNVLIGPELRKLGRCVDIHICLWPDFTIRSSHLITLT
jgi:hypothetical protein